jgi:membrane-bound lytic murein transglycosylase MltF
MMRHMRAVIALSALLVSCVCAYADAATPAADSERQLAIANQRWTGDFDGMLERRMIRVYMPYSRSLYFVDKGRERGIAAELVRDFERWVNQKFASKLGKRPLTVYIVAATRDKLLADLNNGLADIAVGNLTATEERLKVIDFVAPDDKIVNVEILVTGPASPTIATAADLSGKSVHVRKSSSYYASLEALNAKLQTEGKPPVRLTLVPDALEDEDMLEMMNAGLLEAMAVDDWKAKMWAPVLSKIKVHDDVVLRTGTRKGWAIRKGSPKLAAELTEFYETWAKKQGVIPYRQSEYMKRIKTLSAAAEAADMKRFEAMVELFRKYGREYNFDPLMLAAQGYQESTLDQNKKSKVGAVGVMQLMPTTGDALKVGDIHEMEPNIHAGAKYLDQPMSQYFKDAKLTAEQRTLFAFASYNAGPANIGRMRAEAAKRGLDPDIWFNNVEVVTAEKIGIETTTYVRNIFKYYVSYKLVTDAREAQQSVREQLAPATK